MNVSERIRTILLLEKLEKMPEYAAALGITVLKAEVPGGI